MYPIITVIFFCFPLPSSRFIEIHGAVDVYATVVVYTFTGFYRKHKLAALKLSVDGRDTPAFAKIYQSERKFDDSPAYTTLLVTDS